MAISLRECDAVQAALVAPALTVPSAAAKGHGRWTLAPAPPPRADEALAWLIERDGNPIGYVVVQLLPSADPAPRRGVLAALWLTASERGQRTESLVRRAVGELLPAYGAGLQPGPVAGMSAA